MGNLGFESPFKSMENMHPSRLQKYGNCNQAQFFSFQLLNFGRSNFSPTKNVQVHEDPNGE